MLRFFLTLAVLSVFAVPVHGETCAVSLLVLGVAQDGGKPQVANDSDPAWGDPSLARLASSLGLVVRGAPTRRYLFDATPDFKTQLHTLNQYAPIRDRIGLDGVFLTHAHIGHYTGLMLLGHEAAGANAVPVYAMPRMARFLRHNGPWSQLVRYENIKLHPLRNGTAVTLAEHTQVTPLLVPHRQEFSEVVGFVVSGPARRALYLPDIDSWEDWDDAGTRIEDVLADVDLAFIDATFFADGEIPGRDMSGFPHPFVSHSMARFAALPKAERAKIRFIHMNHTNPLHAPDSEARRKVLANGFGVAAEGDVHCLSEAPE